jgi:hypothetical protein
MFSSGKAIAGGVPPWRGVCCRSGKTSSGSCRAEAGIPEEVGFTTKPALAQRMLERAFEAGVPARWVVADALYGPNRSLRIFLERREQPFVFPVDGACAINLGLNAAITEDA